jgi:glutathione S-transferase
MVEMVTVNELVTALPLLIRHSLGLMSVEEQALENARQKAAKVLGYFEKLLNSQAYFVGNSLTLAEIVLGTITPVLPGLGLSLENYPGLSQWTKNLMVRESWQKTQATPEQIAAFKAAMKKLLAKSA